MNKQKGSAIYFSIVILSIILVISIGLTTLLLGQIRIIRSIGDSTIAYYAAESGAEYGLKLVMDYIYVENAEIPFHDVYNHDLDDEGHVNYKVKVFCTELSLPFIIFDDQPLYIHPTDNSESLDWGCSGTAIGPEAQCDVDGKSNTTAIVEGCTDTDFAAKLCKDLTAYGYSDWFLPAKNQLNQMYIQWDDDTLDKGDYIEEWVDFASGFTDFYWSSTEDSFDGDFSDPDYNAWDQSFFDGAQYDVDKINKQRVRCVRVSEEEVCPSQWQVESNEMPCLANFCIKSWGYHRDTVRAIGVNY